jgi:hypothetical protein
MRNILLVLLILSLSAKAQVKYATYWLAPSMTMNMAEKLSHDSLLIIDFENLINNHKVIEEIKRLNPKIKILGYANQMEVWSSERPDRPLANTLRTQLPKAYSLKRTDGKPVVFWPGMQTMNLSDNCPRVDNKKYNEYYAQWLIKQVLSDSLIDGFFADNGTSTIAWVDRLIDSNNDRKADDPKALNAAWKSGMTKFLELIREEKGEDFIIITNKGERTFCLINNGVMFEKFPNKYLGDIKADGWYQCLENARHAGPYTIFQVDFKNLEFGLASSLLLDNVYIAVGQNLPFPEKIRPATGKPLGPMYKKNGVYYRDYEFVKVEVYPEKKIGKLIPKTNKIKK